MSEENLNPHTKTEATAEDSSEQSDFLVGKIEELRQVFPEAFTEGKVDRDKLLAALGDSVETRGERYGLSWAGKADSIRNLQSKSIGTLVPDREESVDFDDTSNLFIEGDNLEVLKLLQKGYHGKVKTIYIDPPYNTGEDFIYPDNFREGLHDYLRYSGQVDGNGVKLSTNIETGGRYHSKWLSMMYPRLFLARQLLRDDGVIFVSIDDNEVHNLRHLMDEVFGEENLEAMAKWRRRHNQPNDKSKMVAKVSEFVLVYSKSSEQLKSKGTFYGISLNEERQASYVNPDEDPKGAWGSKPWKVGSNQSGSKYEIVSPTGQSLNEEWMGSKETFSALEQEGKIYWPKGGNGSPRKKIYLSERLLDGQAAHDFWMHEQYGNNQSASDEIAEIFGRKSVFDHPKPAKLIERIVELSTAPSEASGQVDPDIVLDFFAGAGTSAHAVLNVNALDGGDRKFIMVQLPEPTSDAEYSTIADMSKERIRRAANKLNTQNDGKLPTEDAPSQDRGFRVFKLTSSNFKVWDGAEESITEQGKLEEQLDEFVSNVEPGSTREQILYEILLERGLALDSRVETVSIADKEVFSVPGGGPDGRELLICLADSVDDGLREEIEKRGPSSVVFLDAAFAGNDELKTNMRLGMEERGIEFSTF